MRKIVIGTHNGIFHRDDLVAVMILKLYYTLLGDEVEIIRTREPELLATCDIVVDVGDGPYDHHIDGFNICRSNGVMYASAGLVWKAFGRDLIKVYHNVLKDDSVNAVWETIDEEIIQSVDDDDNNGLKERHTFAFAEYLVPKCNKTADFDECFMNAVGIANKIFTNILDEFISRELSGAKESDSTYYSENVMVQAIIELSRQYNFAVALDEKMSFYRENGEEMGITGQVWKMYGKEFLKKYGKSLTEQGINAVWDEIDSRFIQPIDSNMNGKHDFSFLQYMGPKTNVARDNDYLCEAIEIVKEILLEMIDYYIASEETATDNVEDHIIAPHIFEVPIQTYPFAKKGNEYNEKCGDNFEQWVYFAVFPHPDKCWAAQCIPPSTDPRGQLLPFDNAWKGLKDEKLVEVCGIPGAKFCHNGRFFVKGTKEAVIAMCNVTIAAANNQ